MEFLFGYDIISKKEVKNMQNLKSFVAKIAKNTAENALKRDANSTTCTAVYQPKAPASLDKFKKHND